MAAEKGSLYMSVCLLSQFISMAVHLVMSKPKQSAHCTRGLACHRASLMLPYVLQEAIFKSHLPTGGCVRMYIVQHTFSKSCLSTGDCFRMYRLLHILLLIYGAIWLEEK